MSSGVSACGFAVAEVFAGHAEMAPWLLLSRRRCRVRASGRAGSRTGRSPAAGGGAGGVLDAGAREPMIEGCGERALRFRVRAYAVVVAPRPACGRAACWLHSSLRLSPGVPGEHGAGSRRAGRGQSQGRPRRRGAGGRMNGGLAPGRRPGQVMRPARAGEHGGHARRASRRTPLCSASLTRTTLALAEPPFGAARQPDAHRRVPRTGRTICCLEGPTLRWLRRCGADAAGRCMTGQRRGGSGSRRKRFAGAVSDPPGSGGPGPARSPGSGAR